MKLEDAKAYPIITGDLVDSPIKSNHTVHIEFTEIVIPKGFEFTYKLELI
jgi:hypothetical protein